MMMAFVRPGIYIPEDATQLARPLIATSLSAGDMILVGDSVLVVSHTVPHYPLGSFTEHIQIFFTDGDSIVVPADTELFIQKRRLS